MKKLIYTAILFLMTFSNIFSQVVTGYSQAQKQTFEINVSDLPDTLFVVFGERIENIYFYIDELEGSIGSDNFFLTEPYTCNRYYQDVCEKRVDLETANEVFFGEDFKQDFKLNNVNEIYRFSDIEVHTKLKRIKIFDIKVIKLIFLNLSGDRISQEEYFNNKNAFSVVSKILFKS